VAQRAESMAAQSVRERSFVSVVSGGAHALHQNAKSIALSTGILRLPKERSVIRSSVRTLTRVSAS